MVGINQQDANDYCGWLSLLTGKTYRLLTNIEWEYAAMAGTGSLPAAAVAKRTPLHLTAYTFGHFAGDGNAPVSYFEPNGRGLHQMVGNIWEWRDQVPYLHVPFNCNPWDVEVSVFPKRGGAWTRPPEGAY